jgi:hypothetical protein
MTKQQEITALDAFIAKLGPNSYLGPWMADHRESIVADIHSDLPVAPLSLGAAWRKADQIVSDARESAKVLLDQSRDAADRERARVQKLCDDQREAVASIIDQHATSAYRALTGRVRR